MFQAGADSNAHTEFKITPQLHRQVKYLKYDLPISGSLHLIRFLTKRIILQEFI